MSLLLGLLVGVLALVAVFLWLDARGARQDAQHQVGEKDRQQDQQQPDRCCSQLTNEAAAEDHDAGKFLTFLPRFADNGRYVGVVARNDNKEKQESQWNLP